MRLADVNDNLRAGRPVLTGNATHSNCGLLVFADCGHLNQTAVITALPTPQWWSTPDCFCYTPTIMMIVGNDAQTVSFELGRIIARLMLNAKWSTSDIVEWRRGTISKLDGLIQRENINAAWKSSPLGSLTLANAAFQSSMARALSLSGTARLLPPVAAQGETEQFSHH